MSFCFFITYPGTKLDADRDVHAGGKVELLELINRACGRIDDVEQALVGADFKLFSRLFVDVNGTVHGEFLNAGRQRDRAVNFGSGALGGFNDLLGGAVDGAGVESAESNADFGLCMDVRSIGYTSKVVYLALSLTIWSTRF